MADDLARKYADEIRDDMAALEWLERNQDIGNWDELEELMKKDNLDAGVIKSACQLADDGREWWDDYGGPVSAFFANDVLDIETIIKASAAAGYSSVSAVRALVTFGGPNCWVITTDGEELEILVGWGGDTVRTWVGAPAVASYLYELGAGVH